MAIAERLVLFSQRHVQLTLIVHWLVTKCSGQLNPDTLAGSEARVVSTLGSFRRPQPVDYQGNRHVIDAMEQTGLTRLLLVTSLGCGDSWQCLPERARAAFGHEVRLKSLAESWLQTSALDWTILRPAGLQDGEATGRAELSRGKEVRRADVAIHGLRLLADETALGQIYAIGDPELHRA